MASQEIETARTPISSSSSSSTSLVFPNAQGCVQHVLRGGLLLGMIAFPRRYIAPAPEVSNVADTAATSAGDGFKVTGGQCGPLRLTRRGVSYNRYTKSSWLHLSSIVGLLLLLQPGRGIKTVHFAHHCSACRHYSHRFQICSIASTGMNPTAQAGNAVFLKYRRRSATTVSIWPVQLITVPESNHMSRSSVLDPER